jgi:hypothetical protein
MAKADVGMAMDVVSGREVCRDSVPRGSVWYDRGTGGNNNKGYTVNNRLGYMEVYSSKDWNNILLSWLRIHTG